MKIFRRILAVSLMTAMAIGILVCLFGAVSIWRYKPAVEQSVKNGLDFTITTLDTTYDGLKLAEQALSTAETSLVSMQGTIQTTAKAISSTTPVFEALAGLTGKVLPGAISSAQASVSAASQSAKLIDGIMGTISNLPLIGDAVDYNPETPLSKGLENLSTSMNDVPQALEKMQTGLSNTTRTIEDIHDQVSGMAESLAQMQTSVTEARKVAQEYQVLITNLRSRLDTINQNLGVIMNASAAVLTLFIVWAMVVQFALLMEGYQVFMNPGEGYTRPGGHAAAAALPAAADSPSVPLVEPAAAEPPAVEPPVSTETAPDDSQWMRKD